MLTSKDKSKFDQRHSSMRLVKVSETGNASTIRRSQMELRTLFHEPLCPTRSSDWPFSSRKERFSTSKTSAGVITVTFSNSINERSKKKRPTFSRFVLKSSHLVPRWLPIPRESTESRSPSLAHVARHLPPGVDARSGVHIRPNGVVYMK